MTHRAGTVCGGMRHPRPAPSYPPSLLLLDVLVGLAGAGLHLHLHPSREALTAAAALLRALGVVPADGAPE